MGGWVNGRMGEWEDGWKVRADRVETAKVA